VKRQKQFGPVLAIVCQYKEGRLGMTETHHRGKADKLDDDEATDCEKDSTALSETVVKELCDRLRKRACEDYAWIAHAKAQHNVEQKSGKVCEKHS
jgi:hypothetical protein